MATIIAKTSTTTKMPSCSYLRKGTARLGGGSGHSGVGCLMHGRRGRFRCLIAMTMMMMVLLPPPFALAYSVVPGGSSRRRVHHRSSSSSSLFGALSLSLPELAERMGGLGRAKLAWDLYKNGVDPAVFYAPKNNNGTATVTDDIDPYHQLDSPEIVQPMIAASRRTGHTLGADALRRLYEINGNRTMIDIARVTHVSISADQTTKLLLELGGRSSDGTDHSIETIETVIIPVQDRSTLCISSQVGCRQACTFCATGTMGLRRSLSSDEILVQLFHANRICRHYQLPPIANVVFMGMGEPTDNISNVNLAVQQLTTRELFQLSMNKVCVSTVAPSPDVFGRLSDHCAIAWSVHAVDDDVRRRLVPTTRYKINELRDGLIQALQSRKLRCVMLEYVLIANENDSEKAADALAALAVHISTSVERCRLIVNLIPYNSMDHESATIKQRSYRAPDFITTRAFQKRLWEAGVFTHVRTTRGDDESAACGQLVTSSSSTQRRQQQQQKRQAATTATAAVLAQ
jgi:23S rRNA (adenine2503-C2)-methyltransferase